MNYRDLRIVFMGTPEFAVASLDALVNSGCKIVGVITAPDKPAGRGLKLQESAVKKYSVDKGLNVLQPEKLKNEAFLEELRALNADLQVVVAFRMLPEVVWNMPRMGTINVHASLLPQYRGAAPINWAVINGDRETGVTTFKLKHEIDTGDILLQERIPIDPNETAGEVHDKLKKLGAQVLVKTVEGLADGTLMEKPQASFVNSATADNKRQTANGNQQTAIEDDESRNGDSDAMTSYSALRHAPKLFTETCMIDWTKPVDEVHNLVRGLSPFPGAFTHLNDKLLKIYRSEKEYALPAIAPGAFETDGKHYLKFACKDGFILCKELQMEGKKKMLVEDFLRGHKLSSSS
ncbi:MAG: methionyl-tRNA formyltransferase [Flavisolibacter sp.]